MSQRRGRDKAEKDEKSSKDALDLAGLKLGTLNLSIFQNAASQKNLQFIDLKDNKIASIPGEVFEKFAPARVLDLRKNVLERLTAEISSMVNLEELYVDQNRLNGIPPEVCALPKLQMLSASQNMIAELPKAIGEMKKLKTLVVGDNMLDSLPPELGKCAELSTLYIHHNHFTELPTSIHNLSELSELALEWFRYTTPPLPRVLKGSEWKRVISKLGSFCRTKAEQGASTVSCIDMLSEFSQKAFDPNGIDSKRRTRLHVACLEGHVGVAKALAQSGAKCDSLDCEGYSPLLIAVREEHPDIAATLVKVGIDVNRGGGLFGSPLHVATVNFDPPMVLLLIRWQADVNQTDQDGNTPLHVLMSVFDKGCKMSHQIGQILLKHKADCNLMNSDKWAPLHLAARRGQLNGIYFVLNQVDNVDPACQKGTCNHAASHKKTKSSRVSTCSRTFDLNLRGGSHLWTPLHLAGHACHVGVVQLLIEAGADVFLRNVDGRTCRHVSRGNLAISKLQRKAEDEWLWYRIHQPSSPSKIAGKSTDRSTEDWTVGQSASRTTVTQQPVLGGSSDQDDGLIDSLSLRDDDGMEEITRNIRFMESINNVIGEAPGNDSKASNAGASSKAVSRRIAEKCCETHYSRSELQHLLNANFNATVPTDLDEFAALFQKSAQQGPKHRLPFLLSKSWAKELTASIPAELARGQHILLYGASVANEDLLRMLISNIPQELLPKLGEMKNSEEETLLHLLCKSPSSKAFPSLACRSDVLAFLLTVCPPETFDLDARDLRGQTPLHLAAQFGDIGLVQVLLEHGADPNAQEETTGWTPLHFAVSKAHYHLILQFLHHDSTNVNQVDKFDWPPLLESCSRLDARATALLVNGGARLDFRNQHKFDVLKAVDTSKKDLAAKRWMSCLVVSNGFRFEESSVQLNPEDVETLKKEKEFFESRGVSSTHPPFYVPDQLAPRCHSCKVLFSVTVRRYHCRSCGLVLCDNCFKWTTTQIVCLDERLKSRQMATQPSVLVNGLIDKDIAVPLSESRLTAAVELSIKEQARAKPAPVPPLAKPDAGSSSSATQPLPQDPPDDPAWPPSRDGSVDSFMEPPVAEEHLAMGPPASWGQVVCPASMPSLMPPKGPGRDTSTLRRPGSRGGLQGLSRDSRALAGARGDNPKVATRSHKTCSACATFFENGVGETYLMLERKAGLTKKGKT